MLPLTPPEEFDPAEVLQRYMQANEAQGEAVRRAQKGATWGSLQTQQTAEAQAAAAAANAAASTAANATATTPMTNATDHAAPSNRIILINQYYNPASVDRQAEINRALAQNLDNPALEAVHVLVESEEVQLPDDLRDHPRLVRTSLNQRLTWRAGFDHAAAVGAAAPEGTPRLVAIVANADIWFDATLVKLNRADQALQGRKAYVLARFGDRVNWCVPTEQGHADSVIVAPPVPREVDADYPLGVQGTETRLVYELARQGFAVSNPCLALVSHHEHASNYRTYDPSVTVNGDGRKRGNSPPTNRLPLKSLNSSALERRRSVRATGLEAPPPHLQPPHDT